MLLRSGKPHWCPEEKVLCNKLSTSVKRNLQFLPLVLRLGWAILPPLLPVLQHLH